MKWYRGSAVLIACIISGMGTHSFRKLNAQSDNGPLFKISIDSTFSSQLKSELEKYIRQQERLTAPAMKQEFPSIDTVMIQQTPPNITNVVVGNTLPLCMINAEAVLDQQGKVLLPAHFTAETLNNLPSIITKRANHIFDSIPMELITFVTSLPADILENFTVIWLDKTSIYFRNKRDNHWAFLLRFDQYPDAQKINLCKKVLQQQTEQKKQNNMNTIIDLRFNGQAIVYKQKRNLLSTL